MRYPDHVWETFFGLFETLVDGIANLGDSCQLYEQLLQVCSLVFRGISIRRESVEAAYFTAYRSKCTKCLAVLLSRKDDLSLTPGPFLFLSRTRFLLYCTS